MNRNNLKATLNKERIAKMIDREQVMSFLEGLAEPDWRDFHSDSEVQNIAKSALALMKEQEEQERKWLQNIADNQLSVGGVDPLTEYEQGKWDGLQMAFEILTEGR